MDLVCLPLNQLDVIIGMNWLEFNHVHINCFDKSVSFLELDASDELFVFAKQVDEFVENDVILFIILASMKDKTKIVIGKLYVVCNFPKVFTDDINDLPPERKVEFTIHLVPCISHV